MAKSKKNNVTSDESVFSDDQINDVSQSEVKKLISKGKEKGYLTYVELAKVLSPEKFSSRVWLKIFSHFTKCSESKDKFMCLLKGLPL